MQTIPLGESNCSVLDDDEDDRQAEWSLVGRVDGLETKTIWLRSFPFRIGRRQGLDLTLKSETVSKLHAEISVEDGTVYLSDLNSTNGTFVNGLRIRDRFALGIGDVVQFSGIEFVLCEESPIRSDILTVCKPTPRSSVDLRQLIVQRTIVPHFQPIVCVATGKIVGYEVLARSKVEGLQSAHELFSTAERYGLERELSELVRDVGVCQGRAIAAHLPLFLNTHPREMTTSSLSSSLTKLREKNPEALLVLEIHEAAVYEQKSLRELSRVLRDLRIELAYDDFGHGQSRLLELLDVPPAVLKFDMQLIRGIDTATKARRKAVESLVKMALEVGSRPLAEGVETIGEARTCAKLGFQLVQGYFSGRPASAVEILTKHIQKNFDRSSSDSKQDSQHLTRRRPELHVTSPTQVECEETMSATLCEFDFSEIGVH